MNWHAVDAVDRAVDATRRFLFPFEAVRWAKLGVLAFVMAGSAGAASVGPTSLGISAAGSAAWAGTAPPDVVPGAGAAERVAGLDDALLLVAAAGVLLAALALLACSLAFRLAFYDALATTEVALRRPLRTRFRQAVGLLALLTGVALVVAMPVVAFALAVGPPPVPALGRSASGFPGPSGVVTAALGAIAIGVTLVGAVGSRLTFEFVAPAMVARDVGVIGGWRAVRGSLRGSWDDVAAYLVVHALVATGIRVVLVLVVGFAGVVAAAVGLVAVLVAAIPLGGIEAVFGTTAGALVLGAVLVGSVGAVAVATLPARVVTRTYLTAYEVTTLAGVDPDLAPLPPSAAANDGRASTDEG